MVAHRIPYVATASIAYPEMLIRKVQKALSIKGTKFMHIYSPCPTGWKMDPGLTVKIAKEAISCRAFSLYEVENGVWTVTMKPKKTPLKDYLYRQGRFRHMPDDLIEQVEKDLDARWEELLFKEQCSAGKSGED